MDRGEEGGGGGWIGGEERGMDGGRGGREIME